MQYQSFYRNLPASIYFPDLQWPCFKTMVGESIYKREWLSILKQMKLTSKTKVTNIKEYWTTYEYVTNHNEVFFSDVHRLGNNIFQENVVP